MDYKWTTEEIVKVTTELQRWLRYRRSEIPTLTQGWHEVDNLLEEVINAALEGKLPWQKIDPREEGT